MDIHGPHFAMRKVLQPSHRRKSRAQASEDVAILLSAVHTILFAEGLRAMGLLARAVGRLTSAAVLCVALVLTLGHVLRRQAAIAAD